MATVGIMGGGTFSEFMLATKSGKTPSFDAPGTLTQPSRPPPNGCMRTGAGETMTATDINNLGFAPRFRNKFDPEKNAKTRMSTGFLV